MNNSNISGCRAFRTWLRRLSMVIALTVGAALFVPLSALAQASLPTGEVQLGQSSIEPGFNDVNGKLTYFLTPENAHEKADGNAVAPLYIIAYPTSAAGSVGTLNCEYQPYDNCPSHGGAVAYLAHLNDQNHVYDNGVLGHDHILAAPPSTPAGGGDFNIAWLPVFVFFTNSSAANTRIKTLDQLNAALANGNVIELPVPNGTFHCSIVPAVTYQMGTPVPPVPTNNP